MRRPKRRSSTIPLIVAGVVCVLTSCVAAAAEPSAFSVAAVLVDAEAFDRPHDIELSGNFAFVPGKGGSLAVVDVSTPEQPRISDRCQGVVEAGAAGHCSTLPREISIDPSCSVGQTEETTDA